MRRRSIVNAAVVAVLLGCAIWWYRSSSPKHGAVAAGEPSGADARFRLELADPSTAPAIARALQKLEEISLPGLETVKAVRSPAGGCQWPASSSRTAGDLSDLFLFGFVQVRDLWRHPLLNPADVPICGEDEAALNALLSAFNSDMEQVVSAYREVRTRERIALIESGRIPPWKEGQAPSDSEVANVAIDLGVDHEEARRWIARQPGGGRVPRGNYIHYDGNYYTSTSFGVLPESASMFEHVKFIVGQRVSIVLAWFVANGFQPDAGRLLPVLAEIARAKSQ